MKRELSTTERKIVRFAAIAITGLVIAPNLISTKTAINYQEKTDPKPVRIGDGRIVEIIKGSMIKVERNSSDSFTLTNIDCSGGTPIAYMNNVPLNGTVQPGSMIEEAISYACK
jgi:hypothetical protein